MNTLLLVLQLALPASPEALGFFDKTVAFGPDAFMVPAELDGNPATREWAGWDVQGPYAGRFRGAAWTGGRLCVGDYLPWLVPNDPGAFYYLNALTVPGGLTVVQIQSARWYLEVPIPMPVCQP
jgi:hypothetical protein